MKRWKVTLQTLAVTCVTLLLVAGCVSKGKYNTVLQERDQLQEENKQIAQKEAKIAQDRDNLAETVTVQEAEMKAMRADYERLATVFVLEIEANELRTKMLVDGIELVIPSDVLYKSGAATATVSDKGLAQAKKIAAFLKDTDYFVSVVGHTDSQQPSAKLAERFPTNWDLAAARAANAVKFLCSEGVNPNMIIAVSRGEYEPVASNDTPEGRAQNRRIQIILRRLPE